MPDDGSQLRKIMTSMTQSCACVCVTPSFRDGRQRPPTQLASNSFFSFSSSSSIPFLLLNCSFESFSYFLFFSLFTILLSCSFPIVSWISSPSNPSKFPLSFFIAFFRNIPRFSKLRLIATRFFHSPNAPATALHRHHSHTYLRVISLTVLSPRCIVLLCVLLCLKSFAHLLTSQDF